MRKGDLTIAFKVIALSDLLSDSQKRIAAAILDHYNRHTGRCDPSQTTISEIVGVSRRTVIRAMKGLVSIGFFRSYRHGGNFHCNQYTPVWSRFRQADAAWASRRRDRRTRIDQSDMSQPRGQNGHLSGDHAVTQTIPSNYSYRTCEAGSASNQNKESALNSLERSTTTMELKRASSHVDARLLHVKSTDSKHVMRESARRRWDNELLERFRKNQNLYGRIVELIDGPTADAATEAELKCRHAGAEYIVRAVAMRDLELAAKLEKTSEDPQ